MRYLIKLLPQSFTFNINLGILCETVFVFFPAVKKKLLKIYLKL